jgi:small membrane protein
MTLFQLITLPLITLFFIRSIVKFARGEQPRNIALLTVVIWLLAGFAILRPNTTMQLAKLMGIGRGTDLILYFLVITYLISFFYVYKKLFEMESAITEIVRHLAIRDPMYSSKNDTDEINGEKQSSDVRDHRVTNS